MAVIEYADDSVATTNLTRGAERLSKMTDEELLAFWNESIEARDEHRRSLIYTATEIPPGKPQVEFREQSNQWTPRGHVVRCEILSDASIEPAIDEPFVSIDGRDFTLGEFMTVVGTFGGWGMRIEFVPENESPTPRSQRGGSGGGGRSHLRQGERRALPGDRQPACGAARGREPCHPRARSPRAQHGNERDNLEQRHNRNRSEEGRGLERGMRLSGPRDVSGPR